MESNLNFGTKLTASILIIIVIFLLGISVHGTITGYMAGGSTHGAGKQQGGNPHYGIVKGYAEWIIRDVDNNIINTETPTESIYVYFIPLNETINWNANISCENQIQGAITNIDADDSGSQCSQTDYQTPTSYSCSATLINETYVIIYRTSTKAEEGNQGCFAAKIPAGDFDIYV